MNRVERKADQKKAHEVTLKNIYVALLAELKKSEKNIYTSDNIK